MRTIHTPQQGAASAPSAFVEPNRRKGEDVRWLVVFLFPVLLTAFLQALSPTEGISAILFLLTLLVWQSVLLRKGK